MIMLFLLSDRQISSLIGLSLPETGLEHTADIIARKGINTCVTYQTMLICMNITVRDLNEEVFRKFKGKAAERGMKMGVAVTQAMRLFIEKDGARPARKTGHDKPSDWAKGADSTSEEVDSLLYGK